jgi:hypothetical protein
MEELKVDKGKTEELAEVSELTGTVLDTAELETAVDERAIEELVLDVIGSTDELSDTTLLVKSELAGAVLVRTELVILVDDRIELDTVLESVE